MIIEENRVLYPIKIKQSAKASAEPTGVFTVLDKIEDKKEEPAA